MVGFLRRNVIALLALGIALGGTAYAAVPKIGSKSIKNGAVTTQKLRSGAVTSAKLKDGAVSASKVSVGAVGSSALADGSVGSTKIADGSVTASDIAPGTVPASFGVSGGFAPGLPAGSSIVFPIGQTGITQGSVLAPAPIRIGNLHVVTGSPPTVAESLTLTLYTAPASNPASIAPTPVSCSVNGPSTTCSSTATTVIPEGNIYTFLASRGGTPNGVNFGYTVAPG